MTGRQEASQTIDRMVYLYCRYDADCVMKNIFEIFDTMNTGKINQNEILWVFSMAMNGTGNKKMSQHNNTLCFSVQQKLQWLFKLYDKVNLIIDSVIIHFQIVKLYYIMYFRMEMGKYHRRKWKMFL